MNGLGQRDGRYRTCDVCGLSGELVCTRIVVRMHVRRSFARHDPIRIVATRLRRPYVRGRMALWHHPYCADELVDLIEQLRDEWR